MSLVNLSLKSFFKSDEPHGCNRWSRLSRHLAIRLSKAAETLEDLGIPFEAGDAGDLSSLFGRYALRDSDAEGFTDLWSDLEDFCGATVSVSGREKTLYDLPSLPDEYGC